MIYYDEFKTDLIGTLTLAGDEVGLRYILFEKEKSAPVSMAGWKKEPGLFGALKSQLIAYFKGELMQFDWALAPVGTAFQRQVWDALKLLPYGRLVSYRYIAEAVGNPKAVRAVGGAIGKNPIPILIPCHRVIGSDGSLTGFGGGLEVKRRLIDLELSRM